MFQRLFLVLALAASTLAQATVFTDPKSSILFSQFAKSGVSFGISLPQDATTDFIGQITAQSKMKWAGVSLGPKMVGPILLVSYPNDKAITNSVRQAKFKGNPPEYAGPKMVPIPSGSYVNETHWVSTFLCSKCITGDALSFSKADAEAKFGYAIGIGPVTAPSDPASRLSMHSGGQGVFPLDLKAGKSEKYGSWAALAKGA